MAPTSTATCACGARLAHNSKEGRCWACRHPARPVHKSGTAHKTFHPFVWSPTAGVHQNLLAELEHGHRHGNPFASQIRELLRH